MAIWVTVPVLLARRKPDHIARPDFLDRSTLALRPTAAVGDDQRLAEWMRVPGSKVTLAPAPRAGASAWKSGSMRTVPVKYSCGPLRDG